MDTNVNDILQFGKHAKNTFKEAVLVAIGKDRLMGNTEKDFLAEDVEENLFDLFNFNGKNYNWLTELWEYKSLMMELLTVLVKPGISEGLPIRLDDAVKRLRKLYYFFDGLDSDKTEAFLDYILLTQYPTSLDQQERERRLAKYTFAKRDEVPGNFFNQAISEAHKEVVQQQRYTNLFIHSKANL